jgi:NAD(P)-dependent dehydrogenase (short-subunit alcohol dehydrogenase family)
MSRYAAAHASLNGPGDARPTALQIVEDESLTGKLTDKVFLISGVSSGIGIETLRAIYATGANVIGTVRNLEKAKAVVEEIERNTPSKGKITLVLMDNESLESVRKAAAEIKQLTDQLNVAIFNAGYVHFPIIPREKKTLQEHPL